MSTILDVAGNPFKAPPLQLDARMFPVAPGIDQTLRTVNQWLKAYEVTEELFTMIRDNLLHMTPEQVVLILKESYHRRQLDMVVKRLIELGYGKEV